MRLPIVLALTSIVSLVGCEKAATVAPAPAPVAAVPEAEPEPPAPERFTAGTFYLEWFFDERDERSKLANEKNAKTTEDFEWKMQEVAKILTERDLDIVALQSVGGDREIRALVTYLRDNEGPDYDFAILEARDRTTSQNVAVLSKFPMYGARQLDISLSKQLVVNVSLPDDEEITVVTAMLRSGNYSSQKKRRAKQAKDLRRELAALRSEQEYPLLLLGDIGSTALPEDDGYKKSAPGILGGKLTKDELDDCEDSAGWIEAQDTTIKNETRDRMFLCDLVAEEFAVVGEDSIIRGDLDPGKSNWSSVPVEERDLSDHYMLTSTITLPSIVAARAAKQSAEEHGDGAQTAAP